MIMDNEFYEKQTTRKWHQMSDEEKRKEIEMLRRSSHFKLLPLLLLQQKLKQLI